MRSPDEEKPMPQQEIPDDRLDDRRLNLLAHIAGLRIEPTRLHEVAESLAPMLPGLRRIQQAPIAADTPIPFFDPRW